jgi:uncharacterized secreted protein with C-terminal beta-propeller domain
MRISDDFIRGLAQGQSSFTFQPRKSGGKKQNIPVFVIKMGEEDLELLEGVRIYLGMHNKIYIVNPYLKDGKNRKPKTMLMIRDVGTLKNRIMPMFAGKLIGNKAVQFKSWIKRIEEDPNVAENYKILSRLYSCGYWS